MFRLDVLQGQWLILAIVGGAALVLVFWVSYLARWSVSTRRDKVDHGHEQHRMPLLLTLLYVAAAAFTVIYTVKMILKPPNW